MESNFWQNELIRCCNAIDRETTQSLHNIQAHYMQSGQSVNQQFKVNFLKMINYGLMATYKRFETVLQIDKCFNGVTDLTVGPRENQGDIQMQEASGNSLESCIAGSTPFMVANTPMHPINEILNGMLTPVQQCRFQKETTPDFKGKAKREWICVSCKDTKKQSLCDIIFPTISKLYDHWYSQHKTDVPFRFYSVDLLFCNNKQCGYFSSFLGLQKHHTKQHPTEPFVVVRNGRCALCLEDNNLDTHNCKSIEKVQQLKLLNPIVYTEEDVAELQELNTKFECKYCNQIFDTSKEVMLHHQKMHGQLKIESAKAETKRIVTLICGCCQLSIPADKHVEHLKTIAQRTKRWSNQNTLKSWFQQFEIDYLKTKVVFGNGLVVFKQNLIATDLGGYPGYIKLGEHIFKSLQEK